MANIEQSICDAIDIIVDKAVSEAAYDKTIRATIISCEDESIGYYKLRYQDSTIYAYSLQTDSAHSTNYIYSAGTSVYVLVPANDMTNTKTILGTTESLGNDYVAVVESEDQFSIIGKNIVTCIDTYALQSYRQNGCSINLYNKNNTKNSISIDATAMTEYFADAEVLICGGVMRTELPQEQQIQGDYGIIFTLEFKNQSTNEIFERQYVVNINVMTGQPYNYVTATRQYGIFEFDKENFVDIADITIYCKDFPNWKNNPPDDIFISEIEIEGATRVSQDDLNGYYLSLTTAKGTFFTEESIDTDTLTAEAVLRDAGKIVNIDSQELPVYWFVEHAGITPQSQYYCSFGGSGWKCLNDYLIISAGSEDTDPTVEWIPGNKIFTLTKTELLAQQAQYKCVVVYNGIAVSATVTFKNLSSTYDLSIESSNGIQFYYDIGSTDLITKVNGDEQRDSSYSYAWGISDAFGGYTTLTNDDDMVALKAEYEQEYQEIINDKSLYEEQRKIKLEELNEKYQILLSTTYVDSNRIINIQASSIYIFNIYKCSVFKNDDFIGTATITLLNSDEASGYTLIMNNNSYTYKYDEAGVAPTSSSNLIPLVLTPLTYTLYDCNGQDITENSFKTCRVKWYVPSEDISLLTIPDSYDSYIIGEEQNYIIYEGIKDLAYEIALKYNIAKTANDIYLTVEYQDMKLIAKSNLTFIKQGENGTNGTEYSCKIVPNVADNGVAPTNVIISQISTSSYSYNYTVTKNQPLKVQLYHNEVLVFDSAESGNTIDEGLQVKVTWSVLQNKYNSRTSDNSNIIITDSSNGTMTWDPSITRSNVANIIQVKVEVGNEETILYATLPILSVKYSSQTIANTYTLKLKDNTGFLSAIYASDGTSPQWSNLSPFEFDVTKIVDGVECSVIAEVTNQSREIMGQTYDTNEGTWSDSNNLKEYSSAVRTEEDTYQWWLKPCDKYDGWCVTNAITYSCRIGNGTVDIHVPIHFMLNRYGLANLNGWDGNTIQIDSDGGFILAPQIGAGHKEDDNSFTGMVMGDVRESGNSSYNVAAGLETGLFAYNSGRRTIFLDATTGKSEFGMTGSGQIIIDPTDNTAKIYSGNYEAGVGGLLIDLTTPCIEYGNGNFKIDENGFLTAHGYSTTGDVEVMIETSEAGITASFDKTIQDSLNNYTTEVVALIEASENGITASFDKTIQDSLNSYTSEVVALIEASENGITESFNTILEQFNYTLDELEDKINSIEGLDSWVPYWCLWESGTEAPPDNDSLWNEDQPTAQEDLFLWVKYLLIYTNGDTQWLGPYCVSDNYIRSQISSVWAQFNVVEGQITAEVGSLQQIVTEDYEYLNQQITNIIAENDNISLTVENLQEWQNNFSIGGTQILRGTNDMASNLGSSSNWGDATWTKINVSTSRAYANAIDITDAPNGAITSGVEMYTPSGTSSYVGIRQDKVPVTDGENYVMSAYAKGSGKIRLQYGNGSYQYVDLNVSNSGWVRYSFAFTYNASTTGDTDGTNQFYFGTGTTNATLQICGMKLEIGTIPTDWTDSPSDVVSWYSYAMASIEETTEKISTTVSSLEETVYSFDNQLDAIEYTLSSINELESYTPYFCLSDSGITSPSDNAEWSTTDVVPGEDQFKWIKYLLVYKDGTEVWTTAFCLTDLYARQTLVTNYEYLNTLIEQTSSGLLYTVTQQMKTVSETEDEILSILSDYQTYFLFDSDGLHISQSDSPFEVSIGTEKISFEQNGQEITYISNSVFHMIDAEIESTLKIGLFVWQSSAPVDSTDSHRNLNLIKIETT